jgi:beclin 1
VSDRALTLQFRQRAWTARFRYERLRCTSLLNEAFMVTCHGQFGVINGCRLGRMTGESVSWPEINAALGHTALLVASLAKRMGVVLSRHRIIPMGSFTRICPHGGNERSATPLHYDHHFFANNRLNISIKALGQCVLELQKRVSPSLPLPYPVSNSGEAAGGVSILLTLGTKEREWTAAIRNLLTTLKWIQAWALTHTAPQRLEV